MVEEKILLETIDDPNKYGQFDLEDDPPTVLSQDNVSKDVVYKQELEEATSEALEFIPEVASTYDPAEENLKPVLKKATEVYVSVVYSAVERKNLEDCLTLKANYETGMSVYESMLQTRIDEYNRAKLALDDKFMVTLLSVCAKKAEQQKRNDHLLSEAKEERNQGLARAEKDYSKLKQTIGENYTNELALAEKTNKGNLDNIEFGHNRNVNTLTDSYNAKITSANAELESVQTDFARQNAVLTGNPRIEPVDLLVEKEEAAIVPMTQASTSLIPKPVLDKGKKKSSNWTGHIIKGMVVLEILLAYLIFSSQMDSVFAIVLSASFMLGVIAATYMSAELMALWVSNRRARKEAIRYRNLHKEKALDFMVFSLKPTTGSAAWLLLLLAGALTVAINGYRAYETMWDGRPSSLGLIAAILLSAGLVPVLFLVKFTESKIYPDREADEWLRLKKLANEAKSRHTVVIKALDNKLQTDRDVASNNWRIANTNEQARYEQVRFELKREHDKNQANALTKYENAKLDAQAKLEEVQQRIREYEQQDVYAEAKAYYLEQYDKIALPIRESEQRLNAELDQLKEVAGRVEQLKPILGAEFFNFFDKVMNAVAENNPDQFDNNLEVTTPPLKELTEAVISQMVEGEDIQEIKTWLGTCQYLKQELADPVNFTEAIAGAEDKFKQAQLDLEKPTPHRVIRLEIPEEFKQKARRRK